MSLLNRMATISQELWGIILPSSLSNQVTEQSVGQRLPITRDGPLYARWDHYPQADLAKWPSHGNRNIIKPLPASWFRQVAQPRHQNQEYPFFHSINAPTIHTTSSSKNILSRVHVKSQYTCTCGNIMFQVYSSTHFHILSRDLEVPILVQSI